MKNVLYSLFGVIAGFILAGILLFVSRAPAGEPIMLQPAPTKAPIEVHVLGGVARPGLYKLPDGARMQDAIDAAGGLLTTADAGTMNLAAKVNDGDQINIPCKDNACPVAEPTLDLPNSNQDSATPDGSGNLTGTSGDNTNGGNTFTGELIDVNTATLEELDTLPGIGPATAQKIIDYRNANGPFYAVEDLLNVSGIGTQTLEDIRYRITTGY